MGKGQRVGEEKGLRANAYVSYGVASTSEYTWLSALRVSCISLYVEVDGRREITDTVNCYQYQIRKVGELRSHDYKTHILEKYF